MGEDTWRIRRLKLRILDLWMAHGRKDSEGFTASMREGPSFFRLVKSMQARHVVEIRPAPSYLGAFIAGALPSVGRLLTVLTNGGNVESTEYIPKPFRDRWVILKATKSQAVPEVPDGSADIVVIDVPLESPLTEEAWRMVRPGGVLVDGERAMEITSKENPTLARRLNWCDPP